MDRSSASSQSVVAACVTCSQRLDHTRDRFLLATIERMFLAFFDGPTALPTPDILCLLTPDEELRF